MISINAINIGGDEGRWLYIGDRIELLEDMILEAEDNFTLKKGSKGCVTGFNNPFTNYCTINIAFEDYPKCYIAISEMINVNIYDPIKIPKRVKYGTVTITEPIEVQEVV